MGRDGRSGLESGHGLTSQVADVEWLEEQSNLGYPGGLLRRSVPILRGLAWREIRCSLRVLQ
jgi:hypothetical protein